VIKLPLRKPILLLTPNRIFECRVVHAGDDIVTCVDVSVISDKTADGYTVGIQFPGKVYLERRLIEGYAEIPESEMVPNITKEDLLKQKGKVVDISMYHKNI